MIQQRENTCPDILITLPPKHEKPTKVYTKRNFTMLPSSSVPISTSQLSENILPSDDITPIHAFSDSSSDISTIDLLIVLRKGKHTCTFHSLSNFLLFSFNIFI